MMEATVDDLVLIIGELTVEIRLLKQQLAAQAPSQPNLTPLRGAAE